MDVSDKPDVSIDEKHYCLVHDSILEYSSSLHVIFSLSKGKRHEY